MGGHKVHGRFLDGPFFRNLCRVIELSFQIRVENFIGYASVNSNRLKEIYFIQHIGEKELKSRSRGDNKEIRIKFFGITAVKLLTKDTKRDSLTKRNN